MPNDTAPRKPWEVLREAAVVWEATSSAPSSIEGLLRQRAINLEAAATPKPPTLAEAVRAYLDDPCDGFAHRSLMEALARAEAGQ